MRKRLLSPGFFDNPDLADLPPHARLLFAGLWCHCDRQGRCVDDPRRIRAAVFPYEAGLEIEPMLVQLEGAGFIVTTRGTHGGSRVGDIQTLTRCRSPAGMDEGWPTKRGISPARSGRATSLRPQ